MLITQFELRVRILHSNPKLELTIIDRQVSSDVTETSSRWNLVNCDSQTISVTIPVRKKSDGINPI